MTIAAILRDKGGDVASIAAQASVAEAAALLNERRIGALPVTDGGELAGVISERDIVYCLKDHGGEMLAWPVSRVMSAPAIIVEPSTAILAALALMTRRRIRHLPVIDGGRMIGIVSIGDLVKFRIEMIEAEAEAMRSYIQGS